MILGNAKGTAPHVHIEIYENGSNVNPGKYFKVPRYTNFSKKEKQWLPGAQEQAARFSLNKQKAARLTYKIDVLYKIASELYNMYDHEIQ